MLATSHAAAMVTNVQGGAMCLDGAVGCHGAADYTFLAATATRAASGCFNHFRCTTQPLATARTRGHADTRYAP